jgi:hypothetical protein
MFCFQPTTVRECGNVVRVPTAHAGGLACDLGGCERRVWSPVQLGGNAQRAKDRQIANQASDRAGIIAQIQTVVGTA